LSHQEEDIIDVEAKTVPPVVRKRGRPKGSKNKQTLIVEEHKKKARWADPVFREAMLTKMYAEYDQGVPLLQIAKRAQCSVNTVRKYIKERESAVAPKQENHEIMEANAETITEQLSGELLRGSQLAFSKAVQNIDAATPAEQARIAETMLKSHRLLEDKSTSNTALVIGSLAKGDPV
jgi:hypothetical protein